MLIRFVLAAGVHFFWLVPAADAQVPDAELEQLAHAAADHVLSGQKHLPARSRLMVDTETAVAFSMEGSPMQEGTRAAAARLARELGARPGRLSAVMACRERFPTLEELHAGYSGRCWLAHDVALVIQLGNPSIEGDTATMWLTLWRGARDAEGRPKYVSARGQLVQLRREGDGTWVATGIAQETSGLF